MTKIHGSDLRPASLFKLMTCNDRSSMSASENFQFCKEIHEYVSVPTWLLNPKSLFSQNSFPFFNSKPRVGTAPCSNNFDVGSCSCSLLWHDNLKAYTTFAKLMKFHRLVVVCDTILYATGLDVTDYDRNLNCMKLLHG